MSNAAVLDHAHELSTPVYIVAAHDEVVTTEADTAEAVRNSLLQQYDFRNTGCLQSVLMIYVGAHGSARERLHDVGVNECHRGGSFMHTVSRSRSGLTLSANRYFQKSHSTHTHAAVSPCAGCGS